VPPPPAIKARIKGSERYLMALLRNPTARTGTSLW